MADDLIVKITECLHLLDLSRYPTNECDAWMNMETVDGLDTHASDSVEEIDVCKVFNTLTNLFQEWVLEEGSESLWDTIATITPHAHKALLMKIQYHVVEYTGIAPKPRFDDVALTGAAAAAMYLSLLQVPGAKAHGLYEQALLRRCIGMTKRMIEIAALALPSSYSGAKKARVVPSSAADSHMGRRHTQRRQASAAANEGDEDATSDEEDSMDEDDAMAGRKRSRRGGVKATSGKKPFLLPECARASLGHLLLCLAGLTQTFSFRTLQEIIPMIVDACLATTQVPEYTAARFFEQDGSIVLKLKTEATVDSAAHCVELATVSMLNLLMPMHGSPLTTARLVCKKLKPLLLQGVATASSIALSFGVSGDDDDVPLSEADGMVMPELAKPVEAKTVRGRAVHLVRAIASNSHIGEPRTAGEPIPSDVLCRLPAVAALLQHMCVAAVGAKAEVRAHVTEVVLHVRACLPHSLRRSFVRFVIKFGRSSRVQYRHFAVELAGRLLGVSLASTSGLSQAADAFSSSYDTLLIGLYDEYPMPTSAEKIEESPGYSEEVLAYAIDQAEQSNDTTRRSSTATSKSRPSICMLGSGLPATPARNTDTLLSAGHAPNTAHKSPFYRTGSKASTRRSSTALENTTVLFPEAGEGCADPRPSVVLLMDFILRRMSDKVAGVRTRSISVLTELVSMDAHPYARTNALLASTLAGLGLHASETKVSSEVSLGESLMKSVTFADETMNPESACAVRKTNTCSALIPILLRRMEEDQRPACKKAVLLAMGNLCLSLLPIQVSCPSLKSMMDEADFIDYENQLAQYQALLQKCMQYGASDELPVPSHTLGLFAIEHIAAKGADTSVLVRKAALSAMQSIVKTEPTSAAVQHLWLATVLPLVFDVEATVVAKVVDYTCEVLLENLINWHSSFRGTQCTSAWAWRLVYTIACSDDLKACLSQLFFILLRAHASSAKADAFSPRSLIPVLKKGMEAYRAGLDETEANFVPQGVLRRGVWVLAHLLGKQLLGAKALRSLEAVDYGNKYLQTAKRSFSELLPSTLPCWEIFSEILSGTGMNASSANITLNDTISSIALHFPTDAQDEHLADDGVNCLNVLSLLVSEVKAGTPLSATLTSIEKGILGFSWPPALLGAAVQACVALTSGTSTGDKSEFSALVSRVLGTSESLLLRMIASPKQGELDKYAAFTANVLFVVGEIGVIGLEAESGQGVQDKTLKSVSTFQPPAIPSTIITCIQALIAPTLVSSDETTAGTVLQVPEQVRAHAYVALGKLCLRDNNLAKRYVSVFVRDLSSASSPVSVRNNILFILGDLCVRYTALVDRHVPQMAACVADPSPLIRRHALTLLTQLVVEEYVKLRGPLFYRLASALADVDESVRQTAESAVAGTLMSKHRHAAAAHFIGLLFVSTGCAYLPAYRHLITGFDAEIDGGDIGDRYMDFAVVSSSKRMHVYKTLLKSLPEEQRLVVFGKLATDILSAITEGTLSIGAATHHTGASSPGIIEGFALGSTELLVADALSLLASHEMRSSTLKVGKSEDDDPEANFAAIEDGGVSASTAAAVAKSKLLSKVVRKQIMENVLPICLGLRQFLASKKSPLMQQLLGFLKVLSEDYPEDLKDALATDRQAAAELEFDLRVYHEQQQAKAAAQATPAARKAIIRTATAGLSTPATHKGGSSVTTGTPTRRFGTGGIMTSPKLKTSATDGSASLAASKLRDASNVGHSEAAPEINNVIHSPDPSSKSTSRAEQWDVSVPPTPAIPFQDAAADLSGSETENTTPARRAVKPSDRPRRSTRLTAAQ